MHIQDGYTFAPEGLNGFIEDEMTGFIARLDSIIVSQRNDRTLTLRAISGREAESARAINGSFDDAGLSGYRAVEEAGEIRVIDSRNGESAPLSGDMVITLDKGNNPISGRNRRIYDDAGRLIEAN